MALTAPHDDRTETDLLADARQAAQRAGMSLPEWLDTVAGGLGDTGSSNFRQQEPRRPAADLLSALQARLHELERRSARRLTRPVREDEDTRLVRHLEKRLQALAHQIDTREKRAAEERPASSRVSDPQSAGAMAGQTLSELKDAIAGIAARQDTLVSGFDRAVATYADRVDHRLDLVAERIETRMGESAPADAVRDLDAAIRAIGARLDQGHPSAESELHSELISLVQRLDEVPARIAEEMAPRLEDTARRLDTATRSELDAIRAEMREMAQEMDGLTRSEFQSLHAEIASLAELLGGHLPAAGAAAGGLDEEGRAELAAIREEIRTLASGLEASRSSDHAAILGELRGLSERIEPIPIERLDEIERLIGVLAERFSPVEPDYTALAAIESQIARIAENLDSSHERISGLAEFEQSLSDLLHRFEEEQASNEAFGSLRSDFIELRAMVESSDERTQETLAAVRETLDRIVDRLTDLEEEVEEVSEDSREARARPGEPAAVETDSAFDSDTGPVSKVYQEPQLDPDDLVGRMEAVARAFRQEREDNTPIAPGSGLPGAVADETEESPDNRLTRQPGERESFIAAARRAAQAATAEQTRAFATQDGETSSRSGFGATLLKYRRPLIAALALAIVLAGAAKLASSFVEGELTADSPAGSAAPPSAAAQPAAGPEDAGPPALGDAGPVDPDLETSSLGPAGPVAAPDPQETVITEETDATSEAVSAPDEAVETELPQSYEPDALSPLAPKHISGELPPEEIGSEELRLAAAGGDPAAQFEVAVRYTNGHGVAQDFSKAAHWYRLAAAQGLAPAQYRLGSLYEKGHGVTADPAMARMWYQRAAEQGNRRAMHNLAVLHADGGDGEPDYRQAALWFRQASDYGLKDSQYNLAILHGRGLGVEQDLAEAYRWFAIAAQQGDQEAAAKRDEVARRLEKQTIASVTLALQSWQPKALIPEANTVAGPQGGWQDTDDIAARPTFDEAGLVRQAQALLADLGYQPGPADGQVGQRTRKAVLDFQRASGLTETGHVTPALLDALNRAAS